MKDEKGAETVWDVETASIAILRNRGADGSSVLVGDKVTIAGRKFDLYTVGGNIHMIVLRQGNASYWVINTLRDELSNETMLAIAKHLQPLTAQ